MWLRLFIPVLLILSSCARNPVTGKREVAFISEDRELSIGEESYLPLQQIQGGDLVRDPEVSDYVARVGEKLAEVSHRPHLPWEFTVVNNSTPNAWALPGGKVAINRGLLTELESEAELAAVLGHEIAHATARHGAKNLERATLMQGGLQALGATLSNREWGDYVLGASAIGANVLLSRYSRSHELEADQVGIDYMVKAGYNPEAAVSLQEKFVKLSGGNNSSWLEGLFASHPPAQDRVEANRRHALPFQIEGRTGRELYQRTMVMLERTSDTYAKIDQATALFNDGKVQEAESLIRSAIKEDPMEAHSWGLLGRCRLALDDPSDAIDALDQAIVLNDHYYDFFLLRSQAYEMIGEENQVRMDLEKSVALLPTTEGHHSLAQLDLADGLQTEAMAHLAIASSAQTELGRKSLMQLTELELPIQPGKYIAITPRLDDRGFLMLTANNQSVLAVEDVMVEMISEKGSQNFRFRGKIGAKDNRILTTRIGPYASQAALLQDLKRLEVTGARLVR